MAAKERTKENCRCFDAADPRLRGCTPLRTPIRKSEGPMAKRTQYYCPFLTPSALPPLLSREFPRTPAGGDRGPLVKGGLAASAAWGIPTGCASPPVPGQPPPTKRAGLPPSLTPLVHNFFTAVSRGRACPALHLAITTPYPLHRREGLRGCEQGPRLSGAKPGCEQCLPLWGKQPHERVCVANWRRSLCAAKP